VCDGVIYSLFNGDSMYKEAKLLCMAWTEKPMRVSRVCELSNYTYIARPNRTTFQCNERILLEQRHEERASILTLVPFNARPMNLLFHQSAYCSRNGDLRKDKQFSSVFTTFFRNHTLQNVNVIQLETLQALLDRVKDMLQDPVTTCRRQWIN
jgi:hypothetical protein